ncbi:MAG: TolC family protein [Muribaculaceae bacterium]|nr:TolC family protein [Muribaculaceae bacterium]
MRTFIITVIIAVSACAGASAGTRNITLHEAIAIARTNSVDAAVALDELKSAYWEYRAFRAGLLPEVGFEAVLPGYFKQYNAYQRDDGSFTFVRSNYMQLTGALSVSQSIWPTGGTLSLTTSLDFLRQLDGNTGSRFMTVPVALTLNQPVFGVNTVKWNRRIEPVRYREAAARFMTATENVSMIAISNYFDLLMARENVNVARQNLINAEKLHDVAVVKRRMGQISENDLLQLELNKLNARSTLTDAESQMKSSMFRLRSFLDIEDDVELEPEVPERVSHVEIHYDDALGRAIDNNAFTHNQRRRQLEADYEVAKAKGDMRRIDLYASIGYTGADGSIGNAYRRMNDNQVVQVGVKIPILDWGRRRGRVKVAQSNRQVVESRLRQEAMEFKQDMFILVERFNNQQEQVEIAAMADTIAQKRYRTNVETFMIGKISTLDLNDSQVRKDEQRRDYVNELYLYWYYYYQIRGLTLWDYARGCGIEADIDAVVKR